MRKVKNAQTSRSGNCLLSQVFSLIMDLLTKYPFILSFQNFPEIIAMFSQRSVFFHPYSIYQNGREPMLAPILRIEGWVEIWSVSVQPGLRHAPTFSFRRSLLEWFQTWTPQRTTYPPSFIVLSYFFQLKKQPVVHLSIIPLFKPWKQTVFLFLLCLYLDRHASSSKLAFSSTLCSQ